MSYILKRAIEKDDRGQYIPLYEQVKHKKEAKDEKRLKKQHVY